MKAMKVMSGSVFVLAVLSLAGCTAVGVVKRAYDAAVTVENVGEGKSITEYAGAMRNYDNVYVVVSAFDDDDDRLHVERDLERSYRKWREEVRVNKITIHLPKLIVIHSMAAAFVSGKTGLLVIGKKKNKGALDTVTDLTMDHATLEGFDITDGVGSPIKVFTMDIELPDGPLDGIDDKAKAIRSVVLTSIYNPQEKTGFSLPFSD